MTPLAAVWILFTFGTRVTITSPIVMGFYYRGVAFAERGDSGHVHSDPLLLKESK